MLKNDKSNFFDFNPQALAAASWESLLDANKPPEKPHPTMIHPMGMHVHPYSTSLDNLDPKEFLVDAGIVLDQNTHQNTLVTASSMPNLAIVVQQQQQQQNQQVFANLKNNSTSLTNLEGEFSKYLISNAEMEQYEQEYKRCESIIAVGSQEQQQPFLVPPQQPQLVQPQLVQQPQQPIITAAPPIIPQPQQVITTLPPPYVGTEYPINYVTQPNNTIIPTNTGVYLPQPPPPQQQQQHPLPPIIPQNTVTTTTIPSTPPMGIPKPNGLGSPSKGPGGFANKAGGAPPPPVNPNESITENVANFASSALSLFTGGLTGGSPATPSDNPFESIGRLTEKWEAKGKSLIAKAGASFDFEQDESSDSGMSNSEIVAKQQRASIMEQKLQVCRRVLIFKMKKMKKKMVRYLEKRKICYAQ